MEKNSAPHERVASGLMKAVRVHRYGGIEVITYAWVGRPGVFKDFPLALALHEITGARALSADPMTLTIQI